MKTFCKDDDPELFWPKRWLPKEPEFSSASIHSFGYDSDWGSSKPSSLTVHDFGRSLYEELQTSPLLRQNSKVTLSMINRSKVSADRHRTGPSFSLDILWEVLLSKRLVFSMFSY